MYLTLPRHTRRFPKAEMLADARRAGLRATESLLEDWITLGLMDQATRTGRGRARGVGAWWPYEQHELFMLLLKKRGDGVQIRALTNIPVGLWLQWGDRYASLRQVKRALETYAEVSRPRARHDPSGSVRAMVRKIKREGATRAEEAMLIEALVDATKNRELDPRVRALLERVVGPPAPREQLDGRRAFEQLQAAFAARAQYFEIPDRLFEWARAFYLWGASSYAAELAELRGDPRYGHLHEERDLEYVMNNACSELLFMLGFALQKPEAEHLPEPVRPSTWLAGRARLEIATRILPRGRFDLAGAGGDISIEVAIHMDPSQDGSNGDGPQNGTIVG